MAYAGSLKVLMKYGEDADFTENVRQSHFDEVATVPTKYIDDSVSCATGGTAVIAANRYTTIQKLAIQNKDTSNYVTVTYTSALPSPSGTTCTIVVGPGDVVPLPSVLSSVAVTVTANTAACVCQLFGFAT